MSRISSADMEFRGARQAAGAVLPAAVAPERTRGGEAVWPGFREISITESMLSEPVGARGALVTPGITPQASAPPPAARAARLPEFLGTEGGSAEIGARLAGSTVAIVGVGSIGLPTALNAARLGIGTIAIIDPGTYKPASILTHPLQPSAIGESKAVLAGRMAKAIHPGARVLICAGKVEELPPGALSGADVVLLASDNLAAEAEVGQRCLNLGKPLIHAAVHGETLVAQVRTFSNSTLDASGPCPACQFGVHEWGLLQSEVVFSCAGGDSYRSASTALSAAVSARAEKVAQPTMSTGFLCTLCSSLLMVQLTRQLLGLGNPPEDALIEYAGYGHKMTVSPLRPNPACRCDHTRWERIPCTGELSERTLRELIEMVNRGTDDCALTVDGFSFSERGDCLCGTDRAIGRFVRVAPDRIGSSELRSSESSATLCEECGAPILATDFYCHRDVPLDLLTDVLDSRLRELGVDATSGVRVRAGDQMFELRPG